MQYKTVLEMAYKTLDTEAAIELENKIRTKEYKLGLIHGWLIGIIGCCIGNALYMFVIKPWIFP